MVETMNQETKKSNMSEVDQLMIKQREMLEQDMKHRKYLTNVMVLFWF